MIKDFLNSGMAVLRTRWHFRKATSLGLRTRLWGRASVQNYGTMIVGNRVRFVSTITPIEIYAGTQGRLEIGDTSFINYGCSIAAQQLVRIGPRCHIGTYSHPKLVMKRSRSFRRLKPRLHATTPRGLLYL